MTNARPALLTRPLRVMRSSVVESASNTFTELAFNTPITPGTNTVMRLKGVSSWVRNQQLESTLIGVAGSIVQALFQNCLNLRQNLATMPRLNTPGTLYYRETQLWTGEGAVGSQVGGLTYAENAMGPHMIFPGEGILLATRQLSLYTQGINLQAASPGTFEVQLYYDVIEVSTEELFGVLSTSETF